ncbi:MAG: kinase/pyrophosphorylase [Zoogloeaceae bacterium]|jgi:regulator of PEP synthase PpsR (kinase-PPPase family)|nr:kinase/pyrophosphorylase [Zoogloeaceae bacterium]
MPDEHSRTVFFISDGTGITAETLGHSLLTQFDRIPFRQVRIPFVTTPAQAQDCLLQIQDAARRDGARPIVITTLVDASIGRQLREADALFVDFFETFIAPLEEELGARSSLTIGRSHGQAGSQDYLNRIEAVNFALAHDDGSSDRNLDKAEVILIGVSRSGKTPTSLYLAMQFGIRAANYPLIPEDFERQQLPEALKQRRGKLYGLTIAPERLQQIRSERRPGSHYASLANCRFEIEAAQTLMRREGVHWLDSTTKSIEEIAATIMHDAALDRHIF